MAIPVSNIAKSDSQHEKAFHGRRTAVSRSVYEQIHHIQSLRTHRLMHTRYKAYMHQLRMDRQAAYGPSRTQPVQTQRRITDSDAGDFGRRGVGHAVKDSRQVGL
jgi:hypothetical protein